MCTPFHHCTPIHIIFTYLFNHDMVDTCFYFFHVRKNRTKTPQKQNKKPWKTQQTAQKAHPGFKKSSVIPWGFRRQISEAKVGEAVLGTQRKRGKQDENEENQAENESKRIENQKRIWNESWVQATKKTKVPKRIWKMEEIQRKGRKGNKGNKGRKCHQKIKEINHRNKPW